MTDSYRVATKYPKGLIAPNFTPFRTNIFAFDDNYNDPIQPDTLPTALKEIRMGVEFNRSIGTGCLPYGLINVYFSRNYNCPILDKIFPKTVEFIQFGHYFNEIIARGVLPSSLKCLMFGDHYNHIITKQVLPPNVEELYFGIGFNRHLLKDTLPISLKTLCIDINPNQGLDALPDGLERIFLHSGPKIDYSRLSVDIYIPYHMFEIELMRGTFYPHKQVYFYSFDIIVLPALDNRYLVGMMQVGIVFRHVVYFFSIDIPRRRH